MSCTLCNGDGQSTKHQSDCPRRVTDDDWREAHRLAHAVGAPLGSDVTEIARSLAATRYETTRGIVAFIRARRLTGRYASADMIERGEHLV